MEVVYCTDEITQCKIRGQCGTHSKLGEIDRCVITNVLGLPSVLIRPRLSASLSRYRPLISS